GRRAEIELAPEVFGEVEQLLSALVVQLTVDSEVLEQGQLRGERGLQRRERRAKELGRIRQRHLAEVDQAIAVRILERIRLLPVAAGRESIRVPLRIVRSEQDWNNGLPAERSEVEDLVVIRRNVDADVPLHRVLSEDVGVDEPFDTLVLHQSKVSEDRRAQALGWRQRHADQ